ncbi:MAG: hypothetical protein LCH30_06505 [Proteobacteria bacterium]|nr:hypothetical protein [Pseudomonadota bacterium]
MTFFLANVLGWYLIIFSWLVLFRFNELKVVLDGLLNSPPMFFIIAIFTVIIGLLMVFSHNLWVFGWPVIITIFAWLTLISGIIRLFFPKVLRKMARDFLNNPIKLKIIALILLAIGLFLILKTHFAF